MVYEFGSLGCSGDLAPLAHCALALMGEGEVRDADGALVPAGRGAGARRTHARASWPRRRGWPSSTGPTGCSACSLLALDDLRRLLTTADITAALSVEGLLGTDAVFAADLQGLRPQPGQAASAANMRAVLAGSPIVASHRGPEDPRVQDAYSLRCAPAVVGGARDTVAHAAHGGRARARLGDRQPGDRGRGDAVRVASNGNFHGAPLGYVLDFLAIVAADVASIAERRTDRFLDPARNHGLPAFLADDPGVDSGLMIAQYTQASIVSELKRLAVPGLGRLDPELGDAGGPRLDGLVGGAQAAPLGRRPRPRAGDGAPDRGPGRASCARRWQPAPATGAVVARCVGAEWAGRGPAGPGPEIEAAYYLVRSGAIAAAVTGPLANARRARGGGRDVHAGWPGAGGRAACFGGVVEKCAQSGLIAPIAYTACTFFASAAPFSGPPGRRRAVWPSAFPATPANVNCGLGSGVGLPRRSARGPLVEVTL